MKRAVVILVAVALAVSVLPAQEGKTLAATLETYVFPKAGQDSAQQSKDEAE